MYGLAYGVIEDEITDLERFEAAIEGAQRMMRDLAATAEAAGKPMQAECACAATICLAAARNHAEDAFNKEN